MRYRIEVEQVVTFTHVIEFESEYSEAAVDDMLNSIDEGTNDISEIRERMKQKGFKVSKVLRDRKGESYSCTIDMLDRLEE